jgi:hypothetical protein
MHKRVLRNTIGSKPENIDSDITTYLFPQQCYDRISNREKKDVEILARGHLTANSDFIYLFQRKATYYLSNVAPQWQITNKGNYANLETSVQDMVSNIGIKLDVYSGTHGQMKVK